MSVFPEVSGGVPAAFLSQSRAFLGEEYAPKILACLQQLSEEDVWWRPNDASNSVGNLVLHLCGNARQWIVATVDGQSDVRERDTEFSADGNLDRAALARLLENTIEDVNAVLEGLAPSTLSESRGVQGFEMTIMQAIYHVVEHFSGHTGQISYLTKMRTGKDLGFYEVAADGSVRTHF